MSDDLENCNKASTSNESIGSSKIARSEEQPSRGKERRKQLKKKMLRSSTKRSRLSGGADAEPAAAEPPTETPSAAEGGEGDNETLHHEPGTPPESTKDSASAATTIATRQPLPTTGDPRVDEMLDCALQNLEEAGKALASLGENLEHDLKLFLVELMGRTRKWTGSVESKIEWTRRDILELQKELASRVAALDEARRESAELRAELESSARQLSSQGGRTVRADQSKHSLSKAPSQARSVQVGQSASVCSLRIKDEDGELVDAAAIAQEAERLQMCCAELEAEVIELRKENERIVKERAEYENAIQRALLKGVSSLNVEALKVLRCTPIPSCCPPPCPPSSTVEQMPKSSRDCGSANKSPPCPGMMGNSDHKHHHHKDRTHSRGCNNGGSKEALGSKRVCPSAGHSEKKSRKSKDDNMLLLLHQKDAECFGIQASANPCDPPQRKSNTCGGGGGGSGGNNCGKYGGGGRSNNCC